MMQALTCPDVRDLHSLALGQLPEPEAEPLSQHLFECSRCTSYFNALHGADTLVTDLRAGQDRLPPDDAFLDALVERLVNTPPENVFVQTPAPLRTPAPDGGGGEEPLPEWVGRYQVLGRLGAGGMGEVYRGHDTQLCRDVAIKVPRFHGPDDVRATARQRFQREARAAAAIRHPNVCPIQDVGEDEGWPYVVMALDAGESLAQRLKRQDHFEAWRTVGAVAG